MVSSAHCFSCRLNIYYVLISKVCSRKTIITLRHICSERELWSGRGRRLVESGSAGASIAGRRGPQRILPAAEEPRRRRFLRGPCRGRVVGTLEQFRGQSRIDSRRWKLAVESQWQFGKAEAEERPQLEAVTEQRNWEHWSECNSDLWGVVTSCTSVQ
jgi:hypothetical protein